MLVINPSLTINQDWNHYTNTCLVKYKDILTGKVKAQKTTTRRTGITVAHQYIWHIQVDNAFQFLHEDNTGTRLDGHNFGKVLEYFNLGGDET